ncbi:DUF5988 family protein [Streptomyces sp. NPDC018031]|uniref:DUF5988 family protein n=1 Tax=Streptomyces sp. NPDC018031 TaxID=3365033 RepID=UPI0037A32BCF
MSTPAPNVVLRGGPLPADPLNSLRHVDDVESPLKLPVGNAYEHFEPTGEFEETQGRRLRVFRCIRRTYVAE